MKDYILTPEGDWLLSAKALKSLEERFPRDSIVTMGGVPSVVTEAPTWVSDGMDAYANKKNKLLKWGKSLVVHEGEEYYLPRPCFGGFYFNLKWINQNSLVIRWLERLLRDQQRIEKEEAARKAREAAAAKMKAAFAEPEEYVLSVKKEVPSEAEDKTEHREEAKEAGGLAVFGALAFAAGLAIAKSNKKTSLSKDSKEKVKESIKEEAVA